MQKGSLPCYSHHKKTGDDSTSRRGHAPTSPTSQLQSPNLKKAKTTAAGASTPSTTTTTVNPSPPSTTKKWSTAAGQSDLCVGGRSYHLQPKPHQQHRGLKRPHAGPGTTEGEEADRIEVDCKVARGSSPSKHPPVQSSPTPEEEELVTIDKDTDGCPAAQGDDQGSNDDSVIAQCIRRFRDQPALSRAEREKLRSEAQGSCLSRAPRRDDFWWQANKKGLAEKGEEFMNGSHEGRADEEEEEQQHLHDDKDSPTPGAFRHLKSPTKGSLTDEPVSSLTSQDEEMWPKDDSVEDGGVDDVSGCREDDEASSLEHDLHAEQRALECGEGQDSDLDSRAEVLLQKCKSVLKDFYGPDSLSPPTTRMGRRGKQARAQRHDAMHHSDEDEDEDAFTGDGHAVEDEDEEEVSYGEDVSREVAEEEYEDDVVQEEEESVDQSRDDEPEERGAPKGKGREGKVAFSGGLTGYVDELLGDALHLSLEKPEEAVQRLRARLGLSGAEGGKVQESGADEGEGKGQQSPRVLTASSMVDTGADAITDKSLPPPPSSVDLVSDMMGMNPLPPLPSPRAEPFMDDFPFLPGSPVDSTRATLDSSSEATDVSVSGDLSQGDLRCFEVEGVDLSLKASDTDNSSAWFEVSSSSESSSFTSSGLFLDHRPPSFLLPRGPPTHDASSPPPKGSRQPQQTLTINIPQSQSNEVLRVRRSPSNSPRRRDDGSSPYYYVSEATCAIARDLVIRTVHRALFVPCGANFAVRAEEGIPPSPTPDDVKGDGKELGGDQTPVREELLETPIAAPSSTSSAMSSLGEGPGAMEVEHGKSSGGHHGREGGRGGETTDDQALIEGHMYDTDPIVHALRRRARELKGLLGVM